MREVPQGATVTYTQQYRRCRKPGCGTCKDGAPGHGPYWFAYWREDGTVHSRYLGKRAPEGQSDAEPGQESSRQHTTTHAPVQPRARPVSLRARTLGTFAVWRDGELIPAERWTRRKVSALFKCLLAAPGHRLHRDQLVDLLWPEARPSAGALSLRVTLHLLRQVVDGAAAISHLRWTGDVLELLPGGDGGPGVDWLDAGAFKDAAIAALGQQDRAACRAALDLYTGEYLPDDRYEPWATDQRDYLRQQNHAVLFHLGTLCARQGDMAEAERWLAALLAADPCHERAARALMRILQATGRRSDALRVYAALAAALHAEVGAEPDARTEALRAGLTADGAAQATRRDEKRAAPAPPLRPAPGLSAPLSSFVGRERELADLIALLEQERLVTLIGPGGIGKTRLALQVAARVAHTYDAVLVVELATVSNGPEVEQAVAATLGLREEPGQPLLQTLTAALAQGRTLLVLDNCEHLTGSCADLAAAIIPSCEGLRLLLTSREPLALQGEARWSVPPLSLPEDGRLPPLEKLADYAAVRLFLTRGRAVRPDFALTEENAWAIAHICRGLDGLPLALEMAAARMSTLSVHEIAHRLGDRFRLLRGETRATPPRHQTMRAAIDWSWDLLADPERSLLARLSIFAGGWTLAAAEMVAAGGAIQVDAILDLLAGLIRKSMIRMEEHGAEARYAILQIVRQYAGERLAASGEEAELRARHRAWCRHEAEQAERALQGPDQAQWLARLEREHDNFRAALATADQDVASSSGDGEAPAGGHTDLRLAAALWRFWLLRGHLTEGRRWLEAALLQNPTPADDTPGPHRVLRARALFGAGALAGAQGDYEREETLYRASLALWRAEGDRRGEALALKGLGDVAYDRGEVPQARSLYEESLALRRAIGDSDGIAEGLLRLGNVACGQGNYERAAEMLSESVRLWRRIGNRSQTAAALNSLGVVRRQQGRITEALALHRESLAVGRAVGYVQSAASSLNYLGDLAALTGDHAQAIAQYEEALGLFRELGDSWGIAFSLTNLAEQARAAGDLQRALDLVAEALPLHEAQGNAWGLAAARHTMGLVARDRGDRRSATTLLCESLALQHELGDAAGIADILEDLAGIAVADGRSVYGARLLGAAERRRSEAEAPRTPARQAVWEHMKKVVHGQIEATALSEAWASGGTLAVDAMIAEART